MFSFNWKIFHRHYSEGLFSIIPSLPDKQGTPPGPTLLFQERVDYGTYLSQVTFLPFLIHCFLNLP